MTSVYRENLNGRLQPFELEETVVAALGKCKQVRRVLLVHTDYSRHDFTELLVPMVYRVLEGRGLERLDTLNAGGTHRAMSAAELRHKLGLQYGEYPHLGNLYNHTFDDPAQLVSVGEISADFIGEQTGGTLACALPVTVNKLICEDYDLIVAINGTVPHEAAGFSGGFKIFFPGVAGPEVIGLLHWAAVLIGIPNIIGQSDSPAGKVVMEGARLCFEHMRAPQVVSLNMLYGEANGEVLPKGLYAGTGFEGFYAAHTAASRASARIHLVPISAPLASVVQQIPEMYDEVWTAGKGSYKLQGPGVMAEGGEIILYAPHIDCFHSNAVMDAAIRRLGYHCRDYVVDYLQKNPDFDRNIASHSINVRGTGTVGPDGEKCFFKIYLASRISRTDCEAVGLGYRDPASLRPEDFRGPGKLWIEEGGKWLYTLQQAK